ncbi:putative RNA methyltransferase [Mariniluteicoccus flavus]
MIADVVDGLTCPTCGAAYALDDRTLACAAGHRVDLARQGYANLLGRAAPPHADTAAMVQARADFLAAGHYRPIVEGILQALGASAGRAPATVVDAGAGPGHYLAGVLDALGPDARGIAADISAHACRRASRLPRVGAIVADTWAGLPVADGWADVVLTVFAPRNLADAARMLAPGGRLVVVTPRPDHLASLRRERGLLEVEPDKLGRLDETAAAHLRLVHRAAVTAPLDLDADAVRALVMMGPNAFHSRDATDPTWEPASTTLAVDVSVFAR